MFYIPILSLMPQVLDLSRQRVHAPKTSDAGVVHAVLEGVQNPFSKHLIIPLLPVEEVTVAPHGGKREFWRVCDGVVHGAKTRFLQFISCLMAHKTY